jgi:hypothetical protein
MLALGYVQKESFFGICRSGMWTTTEKRAEVPRRRLPKTWLRRDRFFARARARARKPFGSAGPAVAIRVMPRSISAPTIVACSSPGRMATASA